VTPCPRQSLAARPLRLFDHCSKPDALIEDSQTDAVRLGLPSAFHDRQVKSHYSTAAAELPGPLIPDIRTVSIATLLEARPERVLSADRPRSPPTAGTPPGLSRPAGERPASTSRFTSTGFVVTLESVASMPPRRLPSGSPRFSRCSFFLHSATGKARLT
jgi:chromosomal replication initiator protein